MDDKPARIDHFERAIVMEGDLTDEARAKLLAIANRCPVHQTLEKGAKISTKADSKSG